MEEVVACSISMSF